MYYEIDRLIQRYEVTKVHTVGDSCLILNQSASKDFAVKMIDLGVDLTGTAQEIKIKVRVGIHAGDVLAGDIGLI